MRNKPPEYVEPFRVKHGPYGSDSSYGNNGAFSVVREGHLTLNVIISDGASWDHVSVSTVERCPTWEEMCFIKSLFFEDEECVMQLHPPASQYINHHPFALHLWKPHGFTIPVPHTLLIGPDK